MMATVTTADPNRPGADDPAVREYLEQGGKVGDKIEVKGNMFSGYSAKKVDR